MAMLFWTGIIFTIIAPFAVKVIFNDMALVWVALIIGVFMTIISKFDCLVEFSLGPITAKMNQKIEEADVILKKLQNIALVSSEATLTDLMAGSFMGSMTLKQRMILHDKVVQALKDIGIDDKRILLAEERWRKGISVIFCRAIHWRVELRKDPHHVNLEAPKPNKEAGQELKNLSDFSNWTEPSPEKIKEVLKKYSLSLPEVDQWVDDYAYFLEHNVIRDLDAFVKE